MNATGWIRGLVFTSLLAFAYPCTAQKLDTRIGELEFDGGYPAPETAQKLYDELDYQRAVQTYLWALPMASYGAMADGHRELGAGTHAVILASQAAEQQQLVLTANQDTVNQRRLPETGEADATVPPVQTR